MLARLRPFAVPAAAVLVTLSLATGAAYSSAADTPAGIEGDWITPDQSGVRVLSCGGDLCLQVTHLPPDTPAAVDGLNPDAQLRDRPLCGLQIGQGFHRVGAGRAEGGSLYDPKSGRTYKGTITADGDHLELRGYIGLKLFGRSETWTRAKQPAQMCSAKK